MGLRAKRHAPKTLYFDLDGTIVHADFGSVKPKLADGQLEDAIRAAGFECLVCVANVCSIVSSLVALGREVDGHDMILQLCQGAFRDQRWFRSSTMLIPDGSRRAHVIDFGGDWFWVDDCAASYLRRAGLAHHVDEHRGGRLLIPEPTGDGADIIAWLENIRMS